MKNKLFEITCIILAILIIIFSVNIFTNFLREQTSLTQNQILKRLVLANASQEDIAMLSGGHFLDTAGKYFVGFIDRTVETQEIQKINIEAFFAVYISFPKTVSLIRFDFNEADLIAFCKCETNQDYEEFQENLKEYAFFSSVYISSVETEDGKISFTVNMKY